MRMHQSRCGRSATCVSIYEGVSVVKEKRSSGALWVTLCINVALLSRAKDIHERTESDEMAGAQKVYPAKRAQKRGSTGGERLERKQRRTGGASWRVTHRAHTACMGIS
jgi:hypothetical protein